MGKPNGTVVSKQALKEFLLELCSRHAAMLEQKPSPVVTLTKRGSRGIQPRG